MTEFDNDAAGTGGRADEDNLESALPATGELPALDVEDQVYGISADFVPHVFELYRQADPRSTHVRGLGIGLAIVAQIVKLHGGTVRVESAGLGRGSTFIVTLPLVDPRNDEGATKKRRRSGRSRRAGESCPRTGRSGCADECHASVRVRTVR